MKKKNKTLAHMMVAAILVAALNLSAFAQQDLAKLEGVVRDDAGAIVAGATVTARSIAFNIEREVTTSEAGIYSIPQLRAGSYTLTVKATGFSNARVTDLVLGAGQVRTLDVQLKAGTVSEQVTVTAADEPATIDVSSNRLGVNVTSREVAELPVNGRNFSQLQLLTPGATNTGTGNFNEVRFNARSNEQNQTRLDGIEASAIFDASPGYLTVQGSQFRLQTSLENIQEFRVDSSNYPAEYGTGTGGQINVVGKSGANSFHGSAFHYFRNDALDARNFFDGAAKSPLRLNQFGGSLGGRIIKDRLFFFGSYEGLRQRAGFNVIELTPSDFAREFILSGGTARRAELALNPSAADLARIVALRDTGAINSFPVGSGARLTLGAVTNAGQFVQRNITAKLDEDAFSVRMDAKLSDRFNFYGRYQRDQGDLISPDGATGRLLLASQEPENYVFTLSQLYGASIVNETKFGLNHAPTTLQTFFPDVAGSTLDFSRTSFNLSGSIVQPGVNGGAPTGISSPGGLTRQSSAGNGRAQPIDPWSISFIDNLSVTRGNHGMKFGGEVRLLRVDFDQLGGLQLTYGNIGDFLLNRNVTASFIGDLSASGDFQIATNPVTTITRPESGFHRGRQHYIIWYAQDEWKIRPNITVNYGLRYEYYSTNREKDDRAILFDAATGNLVNPSKDFYTSQKNNFAPRLALTWAPGRLNGKTVIRLGGGLYYGPGQYEDLIQPIESDVFRTSRTIATGITSATPTEVATITAPVTSFTPRAYDINGYKVPERVTQFGLSIQQELPGNTVATMAYVGSVGRNLFQRNITNRILPGNTTIAAGAALPSGVGVVNETNAAGQVVRVTTVREFDILSGNTIARPFGEIDFKTSGGTDTFNALQLTVNRRFTKGLTLGGQYQWGHSIGSTQGSNEAQTSQDPFNFEGERGNNTFDVRHSANISALYELPIGKGQSVELTGIADAFFGGWQVGGVYNARSGLPIDIRVTRADVVLLNPATGEVRRFSAPSASSPLPAGFIAVVNTPGGGASRATRRPDVVPGVNPFVTNGDGLRYLNPAAFAIPRPGTYGNLGRNALYGPGFHQFDMTFQKRFRITEAVRFEFRTEVYNVFNKANFANPPAVLPDNLNTVAGSQQPGQSYSLTNAGNFGVINATVGRTVGLGTNRQIQFSGRIVF